MTPASLKRCSILIPAYNAEDFIHEAVESALSQTYPEIEVIVVNDGSTDGTAEAIQPYLERIIYIEQPNRGLANARNRALVSATGDYIALLDADDQWLPHRLERMLEYHEQHPGVGFSTSDAFLLIGNRVTTASFYRQRFLPKWRIFQTEDQLFWILQYNFVLVMTVVRRDLFERHGIFDENLRSCEDWDLWIRFIASGERCGFVDEPLGFYRLRKESLSNDLVQMFLDEWTVLQKVRSRPGDGNTKGLKGRLDFACGKYLWATGNRSSAVKHFAKAARDRSLPPRTRWQARLFSMLPEALPKAHAIRLRP